MEDLELPDLLIDMRFVKKFPVEPKPVPPQEEGVKWLRDLLKSDPGDFLTKYMRLESDYQRANGKYRDMQARAERAEPAPSPVIAPSEPVWDGHGACPTCKREPLDQETKEARDRGLAWLKEFGGDA